MNDQPKAIANSGQTDPKGSKDTGLENSNPEATPLTQLQDASDKTTHAASPDQPAASAQVPTVDPLLISENSSPQDLVEWGLKKFAGSKIVLSSSFGMEGCALIDMCNKAIEANQLDPITVAYIDTGFFYPETHQLRKKLTERYQSLNFVAWETDVSVKEQAETYGAELWKNNPNLCCNIRKVVPMKKNVVNFDIWVTALRRSQTKSRANTEVISWDWKYQILKFCPFAAWDRKHVWQYIQENDVPFNQLHLQNYPSVSCYHCTKAVPNSSPDSEVRDGRWAGKNKDECGLHFNI